MSGETSAEPGLDWLINNFVTSVPGVASAIVVSTDGIQLAACNGLAREQGEQLAAISSGLLSLTQGAATLLDTGAATQTIVEMDQATLFITAVGDSACLSVLTAKTCEPGLVGYEMTRLVARARDALAPARRHVQDRAEATVNAPAEAAALARTART